MQQLQLIYPSVLERLIHLLTLTINKIEESQGISRFRDPEDAKFRTQYIGQIIRQSLSNEKQREISELLLIVSQKQRYQWFAEKRFKERNKQSQSEILKGWIRNARQIQGQRYVELLNENNKLKKQIDKLNHVINQMKIIDRCGRKTRLQCDNYKFRKFYKKSDKLDVASKIKVDLKYQITELKDRLKTKSEESQSYGQKIPLLKMFTFQDGNDLIWQQFICDDSGLESTSELPRSRTDRTNEKQVNEQTPRGKGTFTQRPVMDRLWFQEMDVQKRYR